MANFNIRVFILVTLGAGKNVKINMKWKFDNDKL